MSKGTVIKHYLAILVVITLASGRVRAQAGEAILQITVLDSMGAAVASAQVKVVDDKQQERAALSDEQGNARFEGLKAGQYRVHIEKAGFAPFDQDDVILHAGRNHLNLNLPVAAIKESVVVKEDESTSKTDPRGLSFTTVLTPDQIAHLPDDPNEMRAVLRAMAGPGAVIRINGFSGGTLPAKSQISQIRLRLDPFAAENHDAGLSIVDVITKPGLDSWHGAINLGFRDAALNARNAFAPRRGPEPYRRIGVELSGPLFPERTSLSLSANGLTSDDSKTIVTQTPGGTFTDEIVRPSRVLDLTARVQQKLAQTHTLMGEYQRNAGRKDNLGVGDFDLPDRAYFQSQVEHLLRFRDTGLLTKRLVNEVLFQVRWQQLNQTPLSAAPAIIVLDAFNSGGAQIQSNHSIRQVMVADNLDFVVANHSLRVGFLTESGSYTTSDRRNATGTFTFASLQDFQAARPIIFTRRLGEPQVSFNQFQAGLYFEDDVRLKKNLTLSYGVRYEAQSHLADRSNFAPRLGIAWSPSANGKLVIRAGSGIFYSWFEPAILEQTLLVNGLRQQDLVIINPGFPDPLASGNRVVLPASTITRDLRMRMPYVEQSSISVQQEITKTFNITATYDYRRAVHFLRSRDVNAPLLPGGPRPDPFAGNIVQLESTANSTYQRLELSLARYAKNLFMYFSYGLSKEVNETDDPLALPSNSNDLRADVGPSLFDSRHNFFAIVDAKLNKSLSLGAIFDSNSATPYNIITGFDDNGDTVINDRPSGVGRNAARGAARVELSMRLSWTIGIGPQKDKPSRRSTVRDIQPGGGDTFGGLSSSETDRRYNAQLYLQTYNVINHTNLINFVGVQSSPFFGHATAALAGRRIECGLRFSF